MFQSELKQDLLMILTAIQLIYRVPSRHRKLKQESNWNEAFLLFLF